jgi:copper(I)-binding protein
VIFAHAPQRWRNGYFNRQDTTMTHATSFTASARLIRGAALMLAAVLSLGSARADDYTVGSLKIHNPWARATATGAQVAGAFLTVTNTGKDADRLIGGSIIAAQTVQVHEMKMDGDVMKMRRMEQGLELPPGATLVLKPGSYHLMLLKLTQPLKQGSRLKGTLEFAKAGKVDVEFTVEGLGTVDPGQAHKGAAPSGGMAHQH